MTAVKRARWVNVMDARTHTHTHFYAFHKVTVEKRRTALRACLAVVLRWRKERSDKMLRFSGEAERSGIHNQVHTGPTLIELKSV